MSDNDLSPEQLQHCREQALNRAQDFVGMLLYYDRKEDDELPVGRIELLVARGVLKPEEIVKAFEAKLLSSLGVK